MRGPISPYLSQYLLLSIFVIRAMLVGVKEYLIVLLLCISLMANDVKHYFMSIWPFVWLWRTSYMSHSFFLLWFPLSQEKSCNTLSLALFTLLQNKYSCLKNPMEEEPGRLHCMRLLRVGHAWATSLSLFTSMHWRRKWQPTPLFLPWKSQGWGSLVGYHLWGRTESYMTEAT